MEALEGKEIKTYTCDAQNFANGTQVNVTRREGSNQYSQMFQCGRHYYGNHVIQYRFLSRREEGDYDVYTILQPDTVYTDQEVRILEAWRHWQSMEGL